MSFKEIVASIYACLETLGEDNTALHAHWCNLLYTYSGDVNTAMWNEMTLNTMRNDVLYYCD